MYGRISSKANRLIPVLGMVLVLASCALPQDSAPPPQAYLLDGGDFRAIRARRLSNKILLVAASREAAGFDSSRIAYTRESPKLDYYKDSVWSDTPAKMLLPVLVRAFESSGAFKAVVAPPSPVLANLRVDVDVIRLQQELMSVPSRVRLIVRLKVVEMKSGHILETRLFEALETAPSDNAAGAARAANVAVQKLLSEMVPFVLRALP